VSLLCADFDRIISPAGSGRGGLLETRERLPCRAWEMEGQPFIHRLSESPKGALYEICIDRFHEELAPIRVRTGPACKRSCPVCVCLRRSAVNTSALWILENPVSRLTDSRSARRHRPKPLALEPGAARDSDLSLGICLTG
jgi:hypothetical protein